jgi:hypothetical protein
MKDLILINKKCLSLAGAFFATSGLSAAGERTPCPLPAAAAESMKSVFVCKENMPKKRAIILLEIANGKAVYGLFNPRKPSPEPPEMAS